VGWGTFRGKNAREVEELFFRERLPNLNKRSRVPPTAQIDAYTQLGNYKVKIEQYRYFLFSQ
jgi:hypothetical protein